MIEFSINTNSIFGYAYIYVDDGTNTRRWLLPTGIVTDNSKLASGSGLLFESKSDAEKFLKHWSPAKGFMSKRNAENCSFIGECQALDCAIEHWKQVYFNVLEGDDHVGSATCSLCLRSKRVKSITESACQKCILNDYSHRTYADRIGGNDYFGSSCCVEYSEFTDKASTANALAMLNTLVELRNKKYGHAQYSEFGTIKSMLKVDFAKVEKNIAQTFINVVMNMKSEPEFKICHWSLKGWYVHRAESNEYLYADGTLHRMCGGGWYATVEDAITAVKDYEHGAMTVGEIEDELGIEILTTLSDVHNAIDEPVPKGYGAIKEVPITDKTLDCNGVPVLALLDTFLKNYPKKQYVFKPGDVVDYGYYGKRIIVDLGYYFGPDNKYLGAIDINGNIMTTSKGADNFKYISYVKLGKLRPASDFILQPVDCVIEKGDVVITNWCNTANELRIVVDDKDGVDLYNFGGHKMGWIKKNGEGDIGYHKVGRIEDFVSS